MILLSENQRHHLIATYVLIEKFTRLMLMFLGLDCKSVTSFPCDGIIGFLHDGRIEVSMFILPNLTIQYKIITTERLGKIYACSYKIKVMTVFR